VKAPAAAAVLAAVVLIAGGGGRVGAVASRTSEGFGAIASSAPDASAGPGFAAATTPASAPAGTSAPEMVTLLLVAAAGFGRGAWLLRRPRPRLEGRSSQVSQVS
jgi:hypothetical protein